MSGVTKHIFESDIRDIHKMWNQQLGVLASVLPYNYSEKDIIESLQRLFPHEWNSVEIKYMYYSKKDRYLLKRFGSKRYNMMKPLDLIETNSMYKRILSKSYRDKYNTEYVQDKRDEAYNLLIRKRIPKIKRIDDKISRAKSKTQQVTPVFLEKLIGLYCRKSTSQKDKVYILAELKKYYSPEIIDFFFKINDTELNRQLREEAFFHLQSFNYQPRLRRQKYMIVYAGNVRRKKYLRDVYPKERYKIPRNPAELEYRIQNSMEQKLKSYDFFISHSSRDAIAVQKLITYLNKQGKNIYCDWIGDADYLKRHLVCDATLQVIENRLDISDKVIFVKSVNSEKSAWCKYELNYFSRLGKEIVYINLDDIDEEKWNFVELDESEFLVKDIGELDLSI